MSMLRWNHGMESAVVTFAHSAWGKKKHVHRMNEKHWHTEGGQYPILAEMRADSKLTLVE